MNIEFVINFGLPSLRHGIERIVNHLPAPPTP